MAEFEAHRTGLHPLQSDDDIAVEALMLARARAAMAWGQLQGLLAHLDSGIARIFAGSIVRSQLIAALLQAGHADVAARFDHWFCGLQVTPTPTPHVFAPACAIVDAILAELARAPWAPIALTAQQLRAVARMDHGAAGPSAGLSPRAAIESAEDLATRAGRDDDTDWPLAMADRLHAQAAASVVFAPAEREQRLLTLPTGPQAVEHARAPTPLWAIDLLSGNAMARCAPGMIPLPCPGAMRAEALAPWLWPRERGVLVADALAECCQRLVKLVATARTISRAMDHALAARRSTSRAPALYALLAGFGPLRLSQIECGLTLSKNGARDLVKTLTAAGLTDRERHGNQVLIRAVSPGGAPPPDSLSGADLPALSADSLDEFDRAMADVDKLLARSGSSHSLE